MVDARLTALRFRHFKVAISFNSQDEALAWRLYEFLDKDCKLPTFCYGEFQRESWGEELSELLPDIYANATFVIILLRQEYLSGQWTGLEFAAIRERRHGLTRKHGVLFVKTGDVNFEDERLQSIVHMTGGEDPEKVCKDVCDMITAWQMTLERSENEISSMPLNERFGIESVTYGEGSQVVRIERQHLAFTEHSAHVHDGKNSKYFLLDKDDSDDFIYVPHLITVSGTRTRQGTTVAAFIFTDIWYFADYERSYNKDLDFSIQCKIGRGGVAGFVDRYGTLFEFPTSVRPGIGPVAATCVIEYDDDRPMHRSKFLITVRKGIRYPGDVWSSGSTVEQLASKPTDIYNSRFIFQSKMPNGGSYDVFVCDFNGENMINLSAKDYISYDGICDGEGKVKARWLNERDIEYCSSADVMKIKPDPLFKIKKRS